MAPLVSGGPAQLGETGVGQAEVVGDLVEDGLLDRVPERPRVADGREPSGPRKIVILLGTGAASAPNAVRGTPW